MKLIFLTRERKKERKAKIREFARQNNSRLGNEVMEGSAKCKPMALGKKSNFEEWKILN